MRSWLIIACLGACGRWDFEIHDTRAADSSVVDSSVVASIEAELGEVVSNMRAVADPAASGGGYIVDDNPEGLPGPGELRLSFDAIAGGYRIWCRGRPVDSSVDSFLVSVDGEPEQSFCVSGSGFSAGWLWTPLNLDDAPTCAATTPRVVSLGGGSHTIVFRSREGQTVLNRVVVTSDLGTAPPAP